VEYRFTPAEFFEHRKQIRLHIGKYFLVGHSRNCKLRWNTSGTGLILPTHLDLIGLWNHPLLHNVIDFTVTGAHPV
jgi:hypothetical protein